MNRKQLAIMLAFSLVAGLTGGILSQRLFGTQAAFADSRKIRAESITLVDEDGNIRILLNPDGNGGMLIRGKGKGEASLIFKIEEDGPHLVLDGKNPHLELFGKNAKLELSGTDAELVVNRYKNGTWTAP